MKRKIAPGGGEAKTPHFTPHLSPGVRARIPPFASTYHQGFGRGYLHLSPVISRGKTRSPPPSGTYHRGFEDHPQKQKFGARGGPFYRDSSKKHSSACDNLRATMLNKCFWSSQLKCTTPYRTESFVYRYSSKPCALPPAVYISVQTRNCYT